MFEFHLHFLKIFHYFKMYFVQKYENKFLFLTYFIIVRKLNNQILYIFINELS